MNADPDEYACYLTDRRPPIGVPLAIYAESADGFSEWFEGDFDGSHWRAYDLPARPPEWYVRGWREVLAPFGRNAATVDCRKFTDPPTTSDPLLMSVPDEA